VSQCLILQADARALPLADGSVHCVVTSPPYFALRDYGVAGQIGLEQTPDAYVAEMVKVFREVWRVLRDDGTLWLNIGDSYSSTPAGCSAEGVSRSSTLHGINGVTEAYRETLKAGHGQKRDTSKLPGIKPKDLIGIPWMLAFALRADGWYLRQDIIWHKPNPMPESCRDRCTKAHEYLFLLTKSPRYYYDAEAVKEAQSLNTHARYGKNSTIPTRKKYGDAGKCRANRSFAEATREAFLPGGRNKRSVWTIPTAPCPEAHFATYPPKLVEPCILAGTSAKGCCPACGAPWKRVVDRVRVPTRPGTNSKIQVPSGWGVGDEPRDAIGFAKGKRRKAVYRDAIEVGNRDPQRHVSQTVGETWVPGCHCNAGEPVPCVVFDPFTGAGTTAIVARQHGRRCGGTELNPEYIGIAWRRIRKAAAQAAKPKRAKRQRAPQPHQPELFAEAV
jgi:DNA modification methylase